MNELTPEATLDRSEIATPSAASEAFFACHERQAACAKSP
jgi:hypothetical protein